MAEKERLRELNKLTYEHRRSILELAHERGKMHLGGDFSCAELMIALFQQVMRIDPQRPDWEDRDRFILSKGHGGGAMYLAMAQRGYFTREEIFATYRTGFETRFGMHPCKAACHELDSSSGSLGHGLPIAAGIALSGKMDHKDFRVFCMLGDGELQAGSNWEALAAAQFKLGNLVAVVDRNMLSLDGPTEDLMPLEPLAGKFKAFNWNVILVEDGNDMQQVLDAFESLPPAESDVPTAVIAHTVKGKGVSFMENEARFHNNAVTEEQYQIALKEIEEAYQALSGRYEG